MPRYITKISHVRKVERGNKKITNSQKLLSTVRELNTTWSKMLTQNVSVQTSNVRRVQVASAVHTRKLGIKS